MPCIRNYENKYGLSALLSPPSPAMYVPLQDDEYIILYVYLRGQLFYENILPLIRNVKKTECAMPARCQGPPYFGISPKTVAKRSFYVYTIIAFTKF